MSRLYVRVMTGFYSHRKTAKLRSMLGDDAFWIPPRLWAYAAENQPDGDLSSYQAGELASLIGYSKDASSMLQALKDSGYMDLDGKIHDWNEHNGYHKKFSVRAKTAADARWAKEKSPTPPKEVDTGKRKGETSIASSMLVASAPPISSVIREIHDSWNALGCVPRSLVISDKRRRLLEVRLREPFFVANWPAALAKIKTSPFLQGQNDRGWRASFEWFIAPDSVPKIMEGKYDNNGHQNPRPTPPQHVDRSVGTLNEGKASQYRGLGKVA